MWVMEDALKYDHYRAIPSVVPGWLASWHRGHDKHLSDIMLIW